MTLHILHWIFPDGVALATWGLVIAGFIQLAAIRAQANSQTKRWDREDQQAAEVARPKYRFGLIPVPVTLTINGLTYVKTGAELWVANFGTSSLYIDDLLVQRRECPEYPIRVNRIVPPGGELHYVVPDSNWQKVPGGFLTSDSNFLYGDYETWLRLSDAASNFESQRFLYELDYMTHHFANLREGAYEPRNPTCPKCDQALNNLVLPPSLLKTEEEVQTKLWKPIMSDLAKTCPKHTSKHLNVIPPAGPR